ncbi:MAG: trehalase-like domain-containing protein, partial [Chloroflexota bacterium]
MVEETSQVDRNYLPLSDYGIIGDSRAAALISAGGSIDWCCWPNFDSPSVFGRLLDYEKGGYFAIRPVGPFQSRRRYVGPTNVLETTFETPDGRAVLTDLMPALTEEQKRHRLIPFRGILRRVVGLEGV